MLAAVAGFALSTQAATPTPPAKADAKAAAPAAAKAAPLVEVVIPKATFVDDPEFKIGKDPFYPDTERRKKKVVVPVDNTPGTTTPVVVVPPAPPKNLSEFIVLKSMFPGKRGRIATISAGSPKSYSWVAGDTEEVDVPDPKYPNRKVKVRCVEVKAKSVVLEIEGEGRKEFNLPE